MMTLPESLKRFRKEFKVTQKQAAQNAEIAERLYQKYEYGEVIPSVTGMLTLADKFDISTDYLLGRTDNPARLQ